MSEYSTHSVTATPSAPSSNTGAQTVLVCGGAGYIGSHMVRLLAQHGHRAIIFDNFSTGHPEVLDSLNAPASGESLPGSVELVRGDLLDPQSLRRVFAEYTVDAAMHFAAFIEMGESVREPAKYYRNNTVGTLNLLESMREFGVDRFVFSSTCGVYGVPLPGVRHIDESHPIAPINPYSCSKRMTEQMLEDFAPAYGLKSMALRYFNAAGAHPDGDLGESHSPESHLIPNVLRAALGQGSLKIFGTDYPTPDGTCVRDYIHIQDLCAAHLAALDFLEAEKKPAAHFCNLGNGNGFSVLEVIETAKKVTGLDISYETTPRRPGDSPFLVGDASRARSLLGWQPAFPTLEQCIRTAWAWHQNPRY